MAISAQDKMLYVANKLGLTSLKDMQGTTRVVYDSVTASATQHTLFKNSAQRNFPLTNLGSNGNQFQVNEALLIETIGFFVPVFDGVTELGQSYTNLGSNAAGTSAVIFDLYIGNKAVLKDVVVNPGDTQAFYNEGNTFSSQLYLEGVGILIPPQVEFWMDVRICNDTTRAAISSPIGAYLFGTGALLNFNTSI
jgi:hypothetical protein